MPYDGSGYSHQGWLTEDQAWFLHGGEGDEQLTGVNTTTRVWDVSDLRNPSVDSVFENDTTSIDHHLYTQGGYAYASNYTTGLRAYDARDPGSGLSEVAPSAVRFRDRRERPERSWPGRDGGCERTVTAPGRGEARARGIPAAVRAHVRLARTASTAVGGGLTRRSVVGCAPGRGEARGGAPEWATRTTNAATARSRASSCRRC